MDCMTVSGDDYSCENYSSDHYICNDRAQLANMRPMTLQVGSYTCIE